MSGTNERTLLLPPSLLPRKEGDREPWLWGWGAEIRVGPLGRAGGGDSGQADNLTPDVRMGWVGLPACISPLSGQRVPTLL